MLVNFFGVTFDEYVDCGERARPARRRRRAGDERLLPQHQGGRHRVRHRPARAAAIWCAQCRAAIKKPLWIKLTPNTSDIVALAKACADNGADGLSIINTITGMAIDARTRRPKIATIFGGLSGPGDQADRAAHGLPGAPRRLPLPISGIGGIQDATDAIEFFLAGASTVQVGTQSFVDPDASGRIVRDLESRLRGGRDQRRQRADRRAAD